METIPSIENANMQTVTLLGLWLFIAIQFNKGKVWPDAWTGRISLCVPLLLAWVPVWGTSRLNAYAQVMAVIYLIGVGFWAVNKAGRNDQQG